MVAICQNRKLTPLYKDMRYFVEKIYALTPFYNLCSTRKAMHVDAHTRTHMHDIINFYAQFELHCLMFNNNVK